MKASMIRAICVWVIASALACAEPDVSSSEEPSQPTPRAEGSDAAGSDAALQHAEDASVHDAGTARDGSPSVPEQDAELKPEAGQPDAAPLAARDAGLDADAASPRDGAQETPDSRVTDLKPLSIFLAGDSTVSSYRDTGSERDQAGWGQLLGAHFNERVKVDNRAVGGATSRHFIEDGRLDAIVAALRAGDVLLVQFGTFLLRADGSVDGTHFQKHGARVLAGFVADEIRAAELPLAAYLREGGSR